MCTSLSAKQEDEQDEPLRAKNRCAVDENDCDLQVATSRRPAFERAQRGIKNADSSVVVAGGSTRGNFYQGPWLQGSNPQKYYDPQKYYFLRVGKWQQPCTRL